MTHSFESLRNEYKNFIYEGYHILKDKDFITLRFDFSIDGAFHFHPETKIKTSNLKIVNDFDSQTAKKIVFCLGMVEAVSYWKSTCAKEMVVKCGELSKEEKLWWKKLYYNGLGEFFYINSIKTDFESFLKITADGKKIVPEKAFVSTGKNIIPIGGGKDSIVTMNLLKSQKTSNMCFTVNDQAARAESAAAAGYCEEEIIKTYRTIDPELLRLNKEGFLNGHTPFSAMLAFLSFYCAYLIGAQNIVLSNESSANEANIDGTDINHQYSKSFEFEQDFNNYVKENIHSSTQYFSILRAFNELQISKQFSALKEFHKVFKSCNVGSKKNIWCCNCAKCLFVYIILSPFLTVEELQEVFGCNILEKEELLEDFKGLAGLSSVKPFECIGTVDEVGTALNLTIKKHKKENIKLAKLLKYYQDNANDTIDNNLLKEFNEENNIPEKFIPFVKEMYDFVRSVD